MDVRRQSIRRGLAWLGQAVDVGRSNPRAVFGAALLFIATLYAAALVGMLPLIAFDTSATFAIEALLWRIVPLLLLVLGLVPVLLGGLMHVVRASETGQPVRATGVFAPFREGKVLPLASLGLVQVLFAVLGVLAVKWLAGADYWNDYMAAMQTAMSGTVPVMPEPENPGLLLLAQLLLNYFSYAIMLLSIPLVMFSGVRVPEAIALSLKAAVKNAGACLLAGVLFVLGMIAAVLVMVLLMGLASLIGGLVHPLLAAALELLLALAFGAIVLTVLASAAQAAWRDMFGPVPATGDPRPVRHAPDQFEA